MRETIVVGADGSPASRNAVDWAAARAADTGKKLQLVHVIDEGWGATTYGFGYELREEAHAMIEDEAARVRAARPGIEVSVEVAYGYPVRYLGEKSRHAHLIVVGSDRLGHLRGAMFGTLGLQIASSTHAPLAVIPVTDGAPRRGVIVGVDGSEQSLGAARIAAREAERSGEPLTIVSVWTTPTLWLADYYAAGSVPVESFAEPYRDALDEVAGSLRSEFPDIRIEAMLEEGRPAERLVDLAASANLLVVGTRGRTALAQLLLGSVSHAVLLNLPCPVLVCPGLRQDDEPFD